MIPQNEYNEVDLIASNVVALDSILQARANGADWGLVLGMITAVRDDMTNWMDERELDVEKV